MALTYGLVAFVSLCMVGVCVMSDKKRDIWLLLVFVSIAVCNLGYFMLSISKGLGVALNSNRVAYLGSVFLPYFMLMMVLRFCGLKRRKSMVISLAVLGILMLAITTSPGILPIYYKTVDIVYEGGSTILVREYGPLHSLYYVYLIGYMLSMIAVAFYAIAKRQIKSRSHTVLLLGAVFCNMIIWLAEQFLPRGFEWLSVSYIITECLILVIYRSMQKNGLMDSNERTMSYTINVLLAVFLLFFANVVRIATTQTTETMYVISQVLIIAIYTGILVSWALSVYERIVSITIRRYLITIVGLMLLWMLMRMLRHTVFLYVFPVGQWCWYAYYVSMILIPQISLMAAKYLGKPEGYRLPEKWYFMFVPSAVLIVGILTNDLHQWAFRFHLGYEIGWDIYQRGVLYYAAVGWIFICIAMMIVEVVRHCRIPNTKNRIWPPVAMLGVGVLYSVLYAVNTNLFSFIEMTAALCFTVVAIWESCIKTGLIQSNSRYDELLKYSGLGMAVVDNDFTVHYCSADAVELPKDKMRVSLQNPVVLPGGIRVSGAKIRGGYSIYQEDISQLLDIIEELNILRENLKDSNDISMQNYKMDKRMHVLAEKNRLHDELYKQTAPQIELLNGWLTKLYGSNDPVEKKELLRRIVVVGAYLKRRNNLALISKELGFIKEEELQLSINEMIKNLRFAGVNCAASVCIENEIPSDAAIQLFDFYEHVVENAFDGLTYLLARFFSRDNVFYCCVDAVCSIDLTTMATNTVSVSAEDENYYTLSFRADGGDSK